MTVASVIARMSACERLNFLLTNRLPRRWLTLAMGRFSRVENRLVRDASLAVWRLFAPDLDLAEARQQHFRSLHECFIRELRPGARPIDPRPDVVVSPCDAIVGACGRIHDGRVYQAKGFPYTLQELLPGTDIGDRYRDGSFVTLRLKSSMYHRFHAPCAARLSRVVYYSGDTWNVNPVALKRVERLFCKNERALLELQPDDGSPPLALVPVAAILVASMRFHCLGHDLDLRHRGPNVLPCDAHHERGAEMGYFQHGSTILVFAAPGYRLHQALHEGHRIRVGEALLERL